MSSPDRHMIKVARWTLKKTQEQCAEVIGAKKRTWQDWEGGRRNMPAAKWELFRLRTGLL